MWGLYQPIYPNLSNILRMIIYESMNIHELGSLWSIWIILGWRARQLACRRKMRSCRIGKSVGEIDQPQHLFWILLVVFILVGNCSRMCDSD